MSRLKSIGYYTECLNNGVDYAIRSDGAVFFRETNWSARFGSYVTSKWQRGQYWDDIFADLPERIEIGFATRGAHRFVPNTKLRLPQE